MGARPEYRELEYFEARCKRDGWQHEAASRTGEIQSGEFVPLDE